jgi:hypothetical protein
MSTFAGEGRKWRRFVGLGLIVALAIPSLNGCYGRFPLTRAVHKGNQNVYDAVEGDNTQRKMAQSAVMWLLLPVYAGTLIGDVVVFNLIEFWTGSQTNITYNQESDGTRVALSSSEDGREMTLTMLRDDKIVVQKHFIRVSATECKVLNSSGQVEGRVTRSQDGSLLLTNAEGVTVQNFSAPELAVLGKI